MQAGQAVQKMSEQLVYMGWGAFGLAAIMLVVAVLRKRKYEKGFWTVFATLILFAFASVAGIVDELIKIVANALGGK